MDYVKQYYRADDICLDIGCGSCRKLAPVLALVKQYYAVDRDPDRIRDARELCAEYKNITFGICDNYFLPFEQERFDLVSSFMAKYNVPEVWRVLKEYGLFLIEIPGADDRRALREKFGKDELGWRGRMLYDSQQAHLQRVKTELSPFFSVQRVEQIQFNTSLKTDKLIELLNMTGEIRNFGSREDILILQAMQNSEGLITFEENRILIVAQKKTKYHEEFI